MNTDGDLHGTKCSPFIEHNTDGKECDTTYMSSTDNFEAKGAGGDTESNVGSQTKDSLLIAEQLSTQMNKVNTTEREQLNAAAQQIIEDLNSKRRQDNQLLADFRKGLETEVNRMCNGVEQQMFRLYDKKSSQIQAKIQELFARLDRICKLETELQEFKQALQGLYRDMNISQ
ncbi:synaptonemal complex central element protein 2-like [Gigantopelta aegis]|uniref:synaptonemal complex central element protein 2-like n=1 Tax=Gigantopelta aegis TaxID=1735272 RepID=UPI001B88791C|nr:synaptonemal complex central element protein 2-like [Gigantopelta aegis]